MKLTFIVLALIISIAVFGGTITLAQEIPVAEEAALGIFRADSPFYFLQQIMEWLRLNLTFNPLERAKLELELMERRAAEIRDLAERGRLTIERLEALQQQGKTMLENARYRLEAAKARGISIEETTQWAQGIINRQQAIMQGVFEHAPEQIQNAIQRATEIIEPQKRRVLELLGQSTPPITP